MSLNHETHPFYPFVQTPQSAENRLSPAYSDNRGVMTMQHPARTELRAILRLAGPLIASQLAHMLMVLTDTLMMARLSPEALAGGGLGAATYSFV